MKKLLLAIGVSAGAVAMMIVPAAADTINFSGQGTSSGACSSVSVDASVTPGRQVWQFNLTQSQPGATMSASFSDGTSVANLAESSHTGKTAKWLIETAEGATVNSATANFAPDGPNAQFTVSHCTVGPEPPTPPTVPKTDPPSAQPVVVSPQFTG